MRRMGTGTEVESRRRTPDGNEDGSEDSSGDGNGNEDRIGNPFKCHEEVLCLQPMIPPKPRFDIFHP